MSPNVFGQKCLLGLQAGINSTNIYSYAFLNAHNRQGFTGGLTYEYRVGKHFSLGADLIYNQRGFVNKERIEDDQGYFVGKSGKVKYQYNYLSLLCKVGYRTSGKWYGFINAAFVPSYLVQEKRLVPTFNAAGAKTGERTAPPEVGIDKIDWAGLLEIGSGYQFKKHYCVVIAFAGQYSFTSYYRPGSLFGEERVYHGKSLVLGVKRVLARQ